MRHLLALALLGCLLAQAGPLAVWTGEKCGLLEQGADQDASCPPLCPLCACCTTNQAVALVASPELTPPDVACSTPLPGTPRRLAPPVRDILHVPLPASARS